MLINAALVIGKQAASEQPLFAGPLTAPESYEALRYEACLFSFASYCLVSRG